MTALFLKMLREDGKDIAILVTISTSQHGGQQQPLSTVSKVTQDNTKNVDIIANKYPMLTNMKENSSNQQRAIN